MDEKPPVSRYFDAPAKINLALHVVGQRDDGYHLIDTLVTFARFGDILQFQPSYRLELAVTGPEAGNVPTNESNLILKAARALMAYVGKNNLGMSITLEKRLPVASGIGGGSANAAGALRGLNEHWNLGLRDPALESIGLALGADIPMCIRRGGLRAQGIGDIISRVAVPDLWIVLVNPRVEVSTAKVFQALAIKNNSPLKGTWENRPPLPHWISVLQRMRNDLETPALLIAPEIGNCLSALRQQNGCLIARMSGSGATCFALFNDNADADSAAERISLAQPNWWVVSTDTMS